MTIDNHNHAQAPTENLPPTDFSRVGEGMVPRTPSERAHDAVPDLQTDPSLSLGRRAVEFFRNNIDTLGKKIAIGFGAVAIAGASALGANTLEKSLAHDSLSVASPGSERFGDISNIDPTTYDPQLLAELASEFPGIEIDACEPFIQAHLPQAFGDNLRDLQRINSYHMVNDQDKQINLKTMSLDSINMADYLGTGAPTDTIQQTLNRTGVKEYMIRNTEKYTDDGLPNPTLAKNLALCDAVPNTPLYNQIINLIDSGVQGNEKIPTPLVADRSLHYGKVFTQGRLGEYDANNVESRVALIGGDNHTNRTFDVVWQTRTGRKNSALQEQVLAYSLRSDMPGFVVDLKKWDPTAVPIR